MDAQVKYPAAQETETKPNEVKGTWQKLLYIVFHMFDSGKKAKKNEEDFQLATKDINFKKVSPEIIEEVGLAHTVLFLGRMISGDFNNYSLSSFNSETDRKLYITFNQLSPDQQMEEFERLENKLMETSL